MRQFLLKTAYLACYLVGLTSLFYFLNRSRQIILSYHNVIPDEAFDGALHLGVSHRASVFERQLAIVKSKKRITTEVPSVGNCVITFDDGLRNNYTVARPILARHGIKACFFVPLQPLNEGSTLVIDQLAMWFSYVPPGEYEVAGQQVIVDDVLRLPAYGQFYAWLLQEPGVWSEIVGHLDSAYPFDRLAISARLKELRFSPMTLDEVESLKREGHTVGPHSWNHLPLAMLDEETLVEDFARCASAVGHVYNTRTYCYPFGRPQEVTLRVTRRCEEAGFTAALMNVPGVRRDGIDHRFAIPRLSLPDDATPYVVHAKLSGLEAFVKRLMGRE